MSGTHQFYTETGRALPPPPRRTPKRSSSVVRLPTRRYDPVLDGSKKRVLYDNPLVTDAYNNAIPPADRPRSKVVVYVPSTSETEQKKRKSTGGRRASGASRSVRSHRGADSATTPSVRTPRGQSTTSDISSDSPVLHNRYGGGESEEASDYGDQFQVAYNQRLSAHARRCSGTSSSFQNTPHEGAPIQEILLSQSNSALSSEKAVRSAKPPQRPQTVSSPPTSSMDGYFSVGGSEEEYKAPPDQGAPHSQPPSVRLNQSRRRDTAMSTSERAPSHDSDEPHSKHTKAYDSVPKDGVHRPQPIRPKAPSSSQHTAPSEPQPQPQSQSQSIRTETGSRLKDLRAPPSAPAAATYKKTTNQLTPVTAEIQSLVEVSRSPRSSRRRPAPDAATYQPQLSPLKAAGPTEGPPSPRYSLAREPVDDEPISSKARRYSASPLRTSERVAGTELLPRRPLLQGMHYDDDRYYRTIIRFINNQPRRQQPELLEMLKEFEGREDELCDALADAYGEEFEAMKYYPTNQVQEVQVAPQRLLLNDVQDDSYDGPILTPPVPVRF